MTAFAFVAADRTAVTAAFKPSRAADSAAADASQGSSSESFGAILSQKDEGRAASPDSTPKSDAAATEAEGKRTSDSDILERLCSGDLAKASSAPDAAANPDLPSDVRCWLGGKTSAEGSAEASASAPAARDVAVQSGQANARLASQIAEARLAQAPAAAIKAPAAAIKAPAAAIKAPAAAIKAPATAINKTPAAAVAKAPPVLWQRGAASGADVANSDASGGPKAAANTPTTPSRDVPKEATPADLGATGLLAEPFIAAPFVATPIVAAPVKPQAETRPRDDQQESASDGSASRSPDGFSTPATSGAPGQGPAPDAGAEALGFATRDAAGKEQALPALAAASGVVQSVGFDKSSFGKTGFGEGASKGKSDAALSMASVNVGAQRVFLPPVAADWTPTNARLAVEAAAPRTERAAKPETAGREAAPTKAAAPPEWSVGSAAEAAPGFLLQGDAKGFATETSSAETPSVAAAAPETAKPASALRRDLEITLAPKDWGGLSVHMKSAGDRLDLAFVADKGETARMIADKSADLASQLHGVGVGLGGIDISSVAAGPEAGSPAATAGFAGQSSSFSQSMNADGQGASTSTPQRREAPGSKERDQGDETSEARPSSGSGGVYL